MSGDIPLGNGFSSNLYGTLIQTHVKHKSTRRKYGSDNDRPA